MTDNSEMYNFENYGRFDHAARDVIDRLAEYRDAFATRDAWVAAGLAVWQEYETIEGDYGVNPARIDQIMCSAAMALDAEATRRSTTRLITFDEVSDVPYMMATHRDRFADDDDDWDDACLTVWRASEHYDGAYWIRKEAADAIMDTAVENPAR